MHVLPASTAARTAVYLRRGVTASAATVAFAALSGPAAAQSPDEQPPEPVLYEVTPGDFLAAIAQDHGLDSWRPLFDANPEIADPDLIEVGQVLRIPEPGEELAPRPLPQPPAPAPAPAPAADATPAPAPATPDPGPAPATEPQVSTSAPAGVWDRLAQCESGGNWHANTGNGYYGGLQFSPSSWQAVGGSGLPHQASRGEQIARGQQLQSVQGWGAWPACSRKLGLR